MRAFDPSELLPPRINGGDPTVARAFVAGRRILVTGAGGSIGSELCRHLAGLGCGPLVLFERHESSLHDVLLSVGNAAAIAFLGDMLDEARLDQAFATQRPEIVFHAAAHKHLPLAEQHVGEVVKNNVTGTRLVAAAAARHGAARFVLVSTDKAVNPSSVMGATRRLSRTLTRRHIIVLAHYFGASREAMVRRLEELGSVKPGNWDWFQANGGITDEQARQVLGDLSAPDAYKADADRPTTLRLNLLAVEAERQGLLSEGQLSRLLRLDRVELREILSNDEFEGGDGDGVINRVD